MSIGSNIDINYDIFKAILYLKDNKNEKGKNYISESRFETIKKRKSKYQTIYDLNIKNTALASYYYEKTVLGYSYSQDITTIYEEKIDDLIFVKDISNEPVENNCKFIGFAKDCYKSKTKAGNSCFTMTITDDSGEVKCKFFNQKIDYCIEMNGALPEEGSLVVCEGKKIDSGLVFLNRIGIQSRLIYTKLSELKDYKS